MSPRHNKYFVATVLCALCLLIHNQVAHSQKVGLVLSGGGARAFAHIGVIKALEENHIPIDYITGTSGGALVGSMYALGYTPAQMQQMVLSFKFQQAGLGIFSDELIYHFLKKDEDASWIQLKISIDSMLRARVPASIINSAAVDFGLMEQYAYGIAQANYDFDSLLVPFRCLASDIKTKRSIVFREGDLNQSVRASMAFPFYFSPVLLNGMILFDGGMYNNFPANVMLTEFNPPIIIGSSAAGPVEIPFEDNIVSQTKTMLVQTTDYKVPRDSDILINCNVYNIGVFDFGSTAAAIDSGYYATIAIMPMIKKRIAARTDENTLMLQRKKFNAQGQQIVIDNVIIQGVNSDQAAYFIKTIKPEKEPVSLAEVEKGFFKLAQDDNVKYLFPRLVYNNNGTYDMLIDARREKDLRLDFGGNFSSRPVNEAFIGIQYNLLGKQALVTNANFYFGKFYNSLDLRTKLIVPGKFPFYLQPFYTRNRWDYFRSSTAFFEDVKPSYLIKEDTKIGINIGLPARNKGRLVLEAGYFDIENSYYQTRNFLQIDTADKSFFSGLTAQLKFERNALNRKMYAAKGSYFSFAVRAVQGNELTYLGTTSPVRDTSSQFNDWLQARFIWDNYYFRIGPVRFGFYSELLLSNQTFFSNYTATILNAPAFEPTQESKTLFLDRFRAHNYLALGTKHIWSITANLDLRIEGYLFQPFQEILKGANDFKPTYGSPFSKRYLSASSYLVYHTPLGPLSIGSNYYAAEQNPYTFMFHFGYIIFNKKALE